MTGKKVLRTYEGSWSTKYMQRSPEIHISMIVTVGTFANLKNYYTFGIVLGYHQGRNERGEGAQCPGRLKVLTMLLVLSSTQNIYSQKILVWKIGAPNLLLGPGTI